MEKIKYVICVALLICVLGCQSDTRRDPYVAAIEAYRGALADFDYQADEKPSSPPKPVFLSRRQPWGRLQSPLGYAAGTNGPVQPG